MSRLGSNTSPWVRDRGRLSAHGAVVRSTYCTHEGSFERRSRSWQPGVANQHTQPLDMLAGTTTFVGPSLTWGPYQVHKGDAVADLHMWRDTFQHVNE